MNIQTKVTVRPSALIEMLKLFMEQNTNVLIVGRPGIGKSEVVNQVTKSLDYDLLITHPAIKDPVDYNGLPALVDGKAQFLPFNDLEALINASRPMVCFIDDFGQATPVVQAAIMQLVQARRVNGHKISDHVRFVAATNGREHRAGVSGILDPVKDRFMILHLEPTQKDWHDWAVRQDHIPDVLTAAVRYRPNWVEEYNPTAKGDIVNTVTPRGLERCAAVINSGLPEQYWFAAFAGCIGQAAAQELKGYIKQMEKLPRLSDILNDPENAKIPQDDPASMFGLIGALVRHAADDNLDAIITYVRRFNRSEYQVFFSQDLTAKNEALTAHPAHAQWAFENVDLFVNL